MTYRSGVPSDNYIKTLNKTGVATRYLDAMARAGIDFSRGKSKPILEIGCAYGAIALPLLKQGNLVVANDLEKAHLEFLRQSVPEDLENQLTLSQGAFPDHVVLAGESLSAVISCWVFHFLTGPEIGRAAKKLFNALEPGGKVFLSASSPYLKFLSTFIPLYEKQTAEGVSYPGWMENIGDFLQAHQVENLPPSMHFLDPTVLSREFTKVGFIIEYAEFFRRDDVTEGMSFDGRENVGLIARRD